MLKKYFYNSIISFILIVSTILTPLSFIPKKAEAQSIGGGMSGMNLSLLPQCDDVEMETKLLFSGVSSLIGSAISEDDNKTAALKGIGSIALTYGIEYVKKEIEKKNKKELDKEVENLASEFDSVKVNIEGTKTAVGISEIQEDIKETQKDIKKIKDDSTCIKAVGRLMIKKLIQKLTVSTVNWINSGFDGSPAFIQDPGKFFNDIAKNEILQFGLEINNPELFPFSKTWMRNTANAFKSKFADNARYSLNELIQQTNPQYDAITFQQDFSQGGWDAWTAMTQVPANNPLGFQLMADNEIQKRLAGTTQSVAQNTRDALQAASGFLGDQRCAEPKGVTKQQSSDALDAGREDPCTGGWEYVTPGKMIADAAGITMSSTKDALLDVEDLNDAIVAILDALLNKFMPDVMEKGFANLGNEGSDGALVFSGIDNEPYRTQTEKDFIPSQLSSSWLSENPNFDIRMDLTQALIDEQRTYSDKLKLQNKELLSTTDGKNYALAADRKSSNAYGLMSTIYQLDYCIPGPHPGWEQDSKRILSAVTGLIVPETEASMESRSDRAITGAVSTFGPLAGAIIGAEIGSAVPVVGTIIGAAAGAAVSFVVNILFGSSADARVRAYYSAQIAALTGYLPDYGNKNDDRVGNISSKQGAVQVLNTILNRYIGIMNKTYFSSPEILPTVAKEAAANFNQLAGYGAMMKNNEDKIASLKNTVNILGDIKNEVGKLNTQLEAGKDEKGGLFTETDYEGALKAQINTFGRLSASMVNGDDIASADNLLKQIIDKKDYIYKNLLKGPYGCEAEIEADSKKPITELAEQEKFSIPWSGWYDVNSVKRMTYPFPILYDYNVITRGTDIPNPWGKEASYCALHPTDSLCVKIKMPTKNDYDTYGPGFLSFILFTAEGLKDDKDAFRGTERLKIHDLVPQHDDENYRYRAVGNRKTEGLFVGGPFETIIGVY